MSSKEKIDKEVEKLGAQEMEIFYADTGNFPKEVHAYVDTDGLTIHGE
jgi:hypothetical protein